MSSLFEIFLKNIRAWFVWLTENGKPVLRIFENSVDFLVKYIII